MTKALDIGCGIKPKNIFNATEVYGIDLRPDTHAGIYRADLVVDPIPFPDNTFDFVTAHEFLEHIPRLIYTPHRRNAFVEVMNEVWRVLKPGGVFMSYTPAHPHPAAFSDPTHVNIITEETFPAYFDHVNRWASAYGFKGAFEMINQEWRGSHLLSLMRKIEQPNNNPAPEKNKTVEDWNYGLYHDDPNKELDPEVKRMHESWFSEDTADFWRHERMMEPLFKCLTHTKNDKWVTVGDGHYGLDAIRMMRRGYTSVLPTNISGTFLEQSKKRGLIHAYSEENAERLSFADDQFDYVLCKESFHHFPRPMIALYEMLRVAKKGVVLIEPQDRYADFPVVPGEETPNYEAVGNYVYSLSRREINKAALGLDLPAVAYKNICDIYLPGVEYVKASDNEALFVRLKNETLEAEAKAKQHLVKPNVLMAIIFKEAPDQDCIDRFTKENEGWSLHRFEGNPYLKRHRDGTT
jgi:ubiquinone/menaquinone biosynthesis C-methylase UbiE